MLLRSGHWNDGWLALAAVLDELDLSPPTTRVGALWRLLWRRAWVRIRGFGPLAPDRSVTRSEIPARERLRLEACRVARFSIDDTDGALGAEYGTRYQVLALQIGDPRSVGLALYMEFVAAMANGLRTPRAARLLDALAAAAERSGDPYLLGHEQAIRSMLGFVRGQWARGREHAAQAARLFRERCLGAASETSGATMFYALSALYMGDLRDYVRELQPLLREADERGDHFTPGVHACTASLMSLIQDQPDAARRLIERAIAPWTTLKVVEVGARSFFHMLGQSAYAEIDLYEGNSSAACGRIDQDWDRTIASPAMRLEFVRARMLSLHGLAVLAVYRSGEPRRRLVRAAARDARGLRAMHMPWTDALARILDAGVALATGARAEARAQLEHAHAELSAAGMNLHATLARRSLGQLTGGAEGARAITEADAWLLAQGVRAPERLARLFIPEVT